MGRTYTAYYCLILTLFNTTHTYHIGLSVGLCNLDELIYKQSCFQRTIEFTTPNPVFYILVHGTFSSGEKFIQDVIWSNEKPEFIPYNFFSEPAYNNQLPIRLAFDWSGDLNDEERYIAGKELAHGIDSIHHQCSLQGIIPKIVILAHSHGGNVVAYASNLITQPIDLAIFLGTPILRFHETDVRKKANLLYLPKNIKQIFSFYSMQDFIQTIGGATTSLKRRYGPITGIDLYNIRLLIDGHEPLHTDEYNNTIEHHILHAVQYIKTLFKKNKNLVLNIDTLSAQPTYFVAIKEYNPEKTSAFADKGTDSLWPDWQQFTYNNDETNEVMISNAMIKGFEKMYHKKFTTTMKLSDRATRALQEVQCSKIIGFFGAELRFFPLRVKEILKKYCCDFPSFTKAHPRASAVLACAPGTKESDATLSAQENEILCNVFGIAGRTLQALPPAALQDLNKRCCKFDSLTYNHPEAAKVLKCQPT